MEWFIRRLVTSEDCEVDVFFIMGITDGRKDFSFNQLQKGADVL